jgi:hypothetical protein
MNRHLNNDELTQLAQGQQQQISKNSIRHYQDCSFCQTRFARQSSIHNLLMQLKPSSTPENIMENVLNVVRIESPAQEKEKTDWLFFIALFSLFVVTSWIIFNGGIGAETSLHLFPLFQGHEDIIKLPSFVYTLKDGFKSFISSFSILQNVHLKSYLFWGLFSLIFYLFIDKKFGKANRI